MSEQTQSFARMLPGINLLPPEVHQRRAAKRLRSWLLLAVALVVALTVGGVIWAGTQVTAAGDRLQLAKDEHKRLKQEEAEYARVPIVLAELANAENAETLAMWREILWEPYAHEIVAILPEDVIIWDYQATNPGAVEGMLAPGHPLEAQSYSTIVFSGSTATRPDVAEWIEAIESVEGFQHAWVDVIEVSGEIDGEEVPLWSFTGSIDLNGVALSERYLPEETITAPDEEEPAPDTETDDLEGDE